MSQQTMAQRMAQLVEEQPGLTAGYYMKILTNGQRMQGGDSVLSNVEALGNLLCEDNMGHIFPRSYWDQSWNSESK